MPYAIPQQILDYYQSKLTDAGRFDDKAKTYKLLPEEKADVLFSAIANNVVGTMISVIEGEKVFYGDPAFYKWNNLQNKQSKDLITKSVTKTYLDKDGNEFDFTADVSILAEKDTDKIKRLGEVLSPGTNLRLDYSDEILKMYPELKSRQYTVMNISDAVAVSVYLDDLKV
ncbi:hypothetical protein [Sharpea azabuensis]|uniref:hypothetical protein n=1 Tax=Sharpea azabuensis TaxID=322505 RepID=UPI001569151A|nr:hypothetical protein [Sharpea azabuensis]